MFAMTSSLFGMTVVCIYAWQVCKVKPGTYEMQKISNTIRKCAITFLNTEYKWALPFIIIIYVFILVAIFATGMGQ